MMDMGEEVYIGVGSNMGDRWHHIQEAIALLHQEPCCQICQVSTLIETTPVSSITQPHFLNGAIHLHTTLSMLDFWIVTCTIEKKMGRETKGDGGPRPIDLDILFFGQACTHQQHLIIPHPLLHTRAFVLKPLLELCPHFIHPILKESIATLYHRLTD